MSITSYTKLKVSLFGESHGNIIGVTLENFPTGIKIDYNLIKNALMRRNPPLAGTTNRKESDNIEFLSGIFNEHTTGSPITLIIHNKDSISSDYNQHILRPSHADYSEYIKSKGFNDYRGGGHHSARLTAPLVAIGSLATSYIKEHFNISIVSNLIQVGHIKGSSLLNLPNSNILEFIELPKKSFNCLDSTIEDQILKLALHTSEAGDSLGGKIESLIYGLNVGVGGGFFNGLESELSSALFSIPSLKAVEFGQGTNFANMLGSIANDSLQYIDGKITHNSNNMGGINGGVSNGNPIVISSTFRPPSSISLIQNTINIDTKTNCELSIKGRHDCCPVLRSSVIIESILSLKILDLLL